jgi:hypothetical protein
MNGIKGNETQQKGYAVLAKYLPEGSLDLLVPYLQGQSLHIKIKKSRASKFGDYRPLVNERWKHQITLNNDLNPYAFLITLVHELAHMQVHIQYKHRQQPHGDRWKAIYARMLEPFIRPDIFPDEVLKAVRAHLNSPTASSCTDHKLYEVIRKHDIHDNGKVLLSTLNDGEHFRWHNGRVFRKTEKLRKRYRCLEVPSERVYLFHPMAEVERMD